MASATRSPTCRPRSVRSPAAVASTSASRDRQVVVVRSPPRAWCTSAVLSGRRAAVARRTDARLVGFSLPAAPTGAVWHSQVGQPAATAVRSPDMRLRRSTGDGAPDADAVAAGQASAAAAQVEASLLVPLDPTAAAFFDVDNTVMQGASIFHLARGLYARDFFTARDIGRFAWQQGKFRLFGREDMNNVHEARETALSFAAGHTVAELHDHRRGGLRRGDGREGVAGHPRPGPDAPRRRAAGLAGHRHPGRGGLGDRRAAGPDRGPGDGRRDRGRRLHRPAGRRDPARAGQGAGRHARSPSARGSTWAPARRTATRPTTSPCSAWSATRAPSTPTPGCGRTPGSTAGGCATTGPDARP